MRVPPSYIANAGVPELPLKFSWEGEGMHFGPSQGTKLHKSLVKVSTCALGTVTALVEEWLIWRLHRGIDSDRFFHHVDATFAWSIDPRYRDEKSLRLPGETPVLQALRDGVWNAQLATEDSLWTQPSIPDDKTAALASVVRQTMPDKQKKAFTAWLDATVTKAAKLSPRPQVRGPRRKDFDKESDYFKALQPFLGEAIPREAFDPEARYKREQREELLNRFLSGLDWKKNPFLRSPEKMKKLGFQGTPYKL